jgi:ABC-2 type transport system permease protein
MTPNTQSTNAQSTNVQSNPMPGTPLESQALAPAVISAMRPLYWSVRRELWENRSIYLAPLGAAVLFLLVFVIHTMILRQRRHGVWTLNPQQQHEVFGVPYEIAAAVVMGTALIVGIFYTLDALYGERRDRSILFWKSLPVSDLTTVLSKFSVPIILLPLLSFAITVVTQFLMLLLSSVVLLGSGLEMSTLWAHSSFLHESLGLLNHMLTVHGLWYAPLYAWLLLVSAWAPRAPILWALLPPLAICAMEKIAFSTTHFAAVLLRRLTGPEAPKPPGSTMADMMTMPNGFFSEPGLWIGLAIAAVFLAATVRLRRYRGPI